MSDLVRGTVNGLRDAGSHSYTWAFLMALVSVKALLYAVSDDDGLQRWLNIFGTVLFAKYAHTTWHRAEERAAARRLVTEAREQGWAS